MTVLWKETITSLIGLAGGLAVGSGLVAFLTVLDIIPRLAQITRTFRYIRLYEQAVVLGALFWTVSDFEQIHLHLSITGASVVGLLQGIFVGMLAAALTEVLNVFPIMTRRLRMESFIGLLLLAIVLGKIVGSLFDWLIYQQL